MIPMTNPKVSQASGNPYWEVKVPVINAKGEEVLRDARVIVNPRFQAAYDKAVAEGERCTQPSFNLLLSDMERVEGSYNGVGSTWKRNNGKHAGTFQFLERVYDLEIVRAEGTQDFTLTLSLQKPVDLAAL